MLSRHLALSGIVNFKLVILTKGSGYLAETVSITAISVKKAPPYKKAPPLLGSSWSKGGGGFLSRDFPPEAEIFGILTAKC